MPSKASYIKFGYLDCCILQLGYGMPALFTRKRTTCKRSCNQTTTLNNTPQIDTNIMELVDRFPPHSFPCLVYLQSTWAFRPTR